MHAINARNVNEAYCQGAQLLKSQGRVASSRNGPVLVMAEPVSTLYRQPRERVLYDAKRDANPFFHLMEALWMLAGRDDVAWISQFNSRIASYSDDGNHFHAAYGYRWRKGAAGVGPDQLNEIVAMLRAEPTTRRAVLQMWDLDFDLNSPSKDIPCNLAVHFQTQYGKLNMTVFNRSNDMLWGAYGSNVVAFSVLQEYIAGRCDLSVGWYEQVSANFHAYIEGPWQKAGLAGEHIAPYIICPYESGVVTPYPLMRRADAWDHDLQVFMIVTAPNQLDLNGAAMPVWENPFFTEVAWPLARAWWHHKSRRPEQALTAVDICAATDWALAARLWLQRRAT